MDFLKKLQNQPDNVKKIILWSIVSAVAIIMVVLWWFFIFQRTLRNFNSEELKKSFNIEQLEEKINQIKQ